jgi:tetratricopeptide (TPR) repeat protein
MSETNPKASKEGQGFAQLFWAARKEHIKLQENAKVTSPAHRAAIAYAQAQAWPWAEKLVEASRLDGPGKTDEALRIIAECQNTVTPEFRSYVHFVYGSALDIKRDHNEAIKAYRKALADPNLDRPGFIWNNLGIALTAKGDHDDAIEAYRKAL